jgi:hypothetical protein
VPTSPIVCSHALRKSNLLSIPIDPDGAYSPFTGIDDDNHNYFIVEEVNGGATILGVSLPAILTRCVSGTASSRISLASLSGIFTSLSSALISMLRGRPSCLNVALRPIHGLATYRPSASGVPYLCSKALRLCAMAAVPTVSTTMTNARQRTLVMINQGHLSIPPEFVGDR